MRKEFLPKYSKELPHHYFFSVAIYPATSSKAGKYYLKYGPIYISNQDIDKIISAMIRMSDEVFIQTPAEALKIEGCHELVGSMSAMRVSSNINNCTMHHISSNEEMDDDLIGYFVEASNFDSFLMEKLLKSKV